MKNITVNVDGVPTKVAYKLVPINTLILDQTNPRIGLFKDSNAKLDLDQDEIEYAIINKNPKAFDKLKESIRLNEGIINPIWVAPEGNKFLVIEGNTRTIIYKQLNTDFPNKIFFKKIPCYVLPNAIGDNKKNFIKLEAHLRGTTQWDTYERARYLYLLWDNEGYSIERLSKLTKLSISEIKSAIKAFTDMEEEYLPKFGNDPTEVFKYSYFVEFEKDKKLQELMRKNSLGLKNFCTWVGTGKIKRAQDVRDLRHIIENKKTKDLFIRRGYDTAMEELSIIKPQISSSLFEGMRKVIEGMSKLTSVEISDMRDGEQPGKVKLIQELNEESKKIIELIQ